MNVLKSEHRQHVNTASSNCTTMYKVRTKGNLSVVYGSTSLQSQDSGGWSISIIRSSDLTWATWRDTIFWNQNSNQMGMTFYCPVSVAVLSQVYFAYLNAVLGFKCACLDKSYTIVLSLSLKAFLTFLLMVHRVFCNLDLLTLHRASYWFSILKTSDNRTWRRHDEHLNPLVFL